MKVTQPGSVTVTAKSGTKSTTVTITATAKDGSGKKVSVKIKIVRQIQEIKLKDTVVLNDGYLEIVGGSKATDLSKLLEILPGDASSKSLNWKIDRNESSGRVFAAVSSAGKLTTLKVTGEKVLCIKVTAKDGSDAELTMYVKILPKK